jgi:hypothetical protein
VGKLKGEGEGSQTCSWGGGGVEAKSSRRTPTEIDLLSALVLSCVVIWPRPVLRVDSIVQDPVPGRSWEDDSIGWVRGEPLSAWGGRGVASANSSCDLRARPMHAALCVKFPVLHHIIDSQDQIKVQFGGCGARGGGGGNFS